MTTFPSSLDNLSTVIRSTTSSRAWMSTTPPGGDTEYKSASSSTSASKKEVGDEKKPSATSSSSQSTPRRIVVRSQKKSDNNSSNNNGNSNNKKNSNSNTLANTEHKKEADADLLKKVGKIYRRRKESNTGDRKNQHPSAATTITPTAGGTGSTHRRKRPPLQNQQQQQNSRSTQTIYDSSRVPVLIPGRELPLGLHQHHHHQHRHNTLSTMNASALLNTKEYCLKSAAAATSSSGTEAARRLLRGKKDLVRILRQKVVYPTHRSYQREPPVPHTLQGHGVPTQLLQNHLDLAGQLLESELTGGNAAEVSFQNCTGALSLDRMRVRSPDGHSSLRAWPIVVPPTAQDSDGDDSSNHDATMESWDQDMALYLSAMNRLATQLSVVLQNQSLTPKTSTRKRTMTDDASATPTTTTTDEYSNVFSTFSSDSQQEEQIPMYPPPPRYWNVKVWRGGMAYAADSLPAKPCPVVEWTPVQGLEAPGHVCIRLQGFPSLSTSSSTTDSNCKPLRRRQPQPVTLSFTACFRNDSAPSLSSSSSNGGNKRD
jgi:hypothetical protein